MQDVFDPKKLRAARERSGLGQAELARKVGVTPLTWWRWERGVVGPAGPRKKKKVAKALGVDLDSLVKR